MITNASPVGIAKADEPDALLASSRGNQARGTAATWRYRISCVILLCLANCTADKAADPTKAVPGVAVAEAALSGGLPQTALAVTNAILRSHPRDFGALVRQGAALAQLGQPEAAKEAFRRAADVTPGAAAPLLGLGRLALAGGQANEAERSFRQVLATTPNDATALNDLGVALDMQGRHAEAQSTYEKLLSFAPNDQAASINLALSYSLSGQFSRSVEMLRGPGSRPDATPRVRQDLAVALTLSGNAHEAEKLLLTDLSASDATAALAGYRALNAVAK